MRPLAGDDAHGRPRTSDPDGLATFRLPPAPQMTYSVGDESTIGSPSQPPLPLPHRRAKDHRAAPNPEHPEHSKPRVPSHHDFERNKESTAARPSSSKGPLPDAAAPRHEDYDPARLPSPFPRSTDTPSLSQPLTPVFLGASGPASALSSISSRRNSLCLSDDLLPSCPPSMKDGDGEVAVEDDEDEAEQQAETDAAEGEASCSSMMDSGSAPQLVMPSIKMPSRRPFTDDGKRMGRLKVLIAGDSGVGKTSLIKAVVQSCEHIVHVDPITPSAAAGFLGSSLSSSSAMMNRSAQTVGGAGGGGGRRGSRRASARESIAGTSQITEIYASTKPYPEWWSEVDDFRVLRRRKSLGDAVLDRNICFVDTPGYGSGSSSMDTITPVVEYIEAHLQRINSNSLSDGDLLNLLGGEGGVQVDAVFYLVSNRLRPVDIEYLRQLTPLTNIIILLAQTDLMSPSQVAASKAQIHSQLAEASIRLFSFSPAPSSSPDHPDNNNNQGVYAISSAAGPDHDTMDASLLMSPDYVQPLIPTELAHLVSHVFTPNGVARLRHAVARKYVQWRKADSSSTSSSRPPCLPRHHTLPAPTSRSSFASFGASTPDNASTPPLSMNMGMNMGMGGSSNYAPLARRLADHMQREERLAQVRLANWAADLQRSLAREREQYAALARGERAVWLAERIGECVREGGLVVANQDRQNNISDRGEGPGCGGASGGEEVVPRGGRRRERHQYRRYRGGGGGREEKGQYLGQDRGQEQGQSQQSQRHRQDPLGLLEVADELRLRGLVALEVLGSIGVLGGLALWVTRHYLHLQPPAYGWLAGEWERFWHGAR